MNRVQRGTTPRITSSTRRERQLRQRRRQVCRLIGASTASGNGGKGVDVFENAADLNGNLHTANVSAGGASDGDRPRHRRHGPHDLGRRGQRLGGGKNNGQTDCNIGGFPCS